MRIPAAARFALSLTAVASALLGAARPAGAVASAWSQNPQGRVRLITPYRVAPRHGELRLGIHFLLSPGWHVYWKNSGDAGFPPVVGVTGVPALAAKAELLWPRPQRFDLPGQLVAFGYENEVVYPVTARIETAGDRVVLTADVDYLTCQIDCVPYRYKLTVEQPLADAAIPDPETAPLVDRFWNLLPVTAERAAGVTTDAAIDVSHPSEPVLTVRVSGAKGDPSLADLFLEPIADLEAGRPVASALPAAPGGVGGAGGLSFRVPLHPKQVNLKLPAATRVAWTVTGLEKDGAPWSLEAAGQVQDNFPVMAVDHQGQVLAVGARMCLDQAESVALLAHCA